VSANKMAAPATIKAKITPNTGNETNSATGETRMAKR
jgi:hypothetical protein